MTPNPANRHHTLGSTRFDNQKHIQLADNKITNRWVKLSISLERRASDRVWLDYTRPVWCEGEVYLSPDRSGEKVRSTCQQTGLVRR